MVVTMVGVLCSASLHEVLRATYDSMLPLAEPMMSVGRGLAGLGALFYVSTRVWSSLARAEPIDVYPLLRPFALGLCILLYPGLLGVFNGVLSPLVAATEGMVVAQRDDLEGMVARREQLQRDAWAQDPSTAHLASDEAFERRLDELGINIVAKGGLYFERAMYDMRRWVMEGVRGVLAMLYDAAGLIIDSLRTFFLVVLSILGPVVLGLSVWDGLGSSLVGWVSRYISVYLWLPVSSILAALLTRIEYLMVERDVLRLEAGGGVDPFGWQFMVFFLIGIVGFMSVPTVAGWIVEAGGGGGAYSRNVNAAARRGGMLAGKGAAAAGGAAAGNVAGRLKKAREALRQRPLSQRVQQGMARLRARRYH